MIPNSFYDAVLSCSKCKDVLQTPDPMIGYGGDMIMLVDFKPDNDQRESNRMDYTHNAATKDVLMQSLAKVNWPISSTYFTYIFKCGGDNSVAERCYSRWFSQELVLVNPFAVVALGKEAGDFLRERTTKPLYVLEHYYALDVNHRRFHEWLNQLNGIITTIKYDVKTDARTI